MVKNKIIRGITNDRRKLLSEENIDHKEIASAQVDYIDNIEMLS